MEEMQCKDWEEFARALAKTIGVEWQEDAPPVVNAYAIGKRIGEMQHTQGELPAPSEIKARVDGGTMLFAVEKAKRRRPR